MKSYIKMPKILTIQGAKQKCSNELFRIAQKAGFDMRSCIGFEWRGDDVDLTQPPTPEQKSSGRKTRNL
jgi:hypothetical protein